MFLAAEMKQLCYSEAVLKTSGRCSPEDAPGRAGLPHEYRQEDDDRDRDTQQPEENGSAHSEVLSGFALIFDFVVAVAELATLRRRPGRGEGTE